MSARKAPPRPDPSLRRRLLAGMIRVRAAEDGIVARYGKQEMRCPVHLSIGQEAVAVGVCAALEGRDMIFGTHRAHAQYLAKGGDLDAMVAEIHGKETGCCSGLGGSMHLIDVDAGVRGATPIVGGSLPLAVGAAFAVWQRGSDEVVAVFFGEGATEEGVYSECLNFAALKKLPVLFVCENNLYSVYSPLSVRQPEGRDRVAVAAAMGVPGARGDGNDPESVHRLSADAVARIRRGGGPEFVEFDTYRWREHCGVNYDNDIGYRTPEEFERWRAKDPIATYEKRLLAEEAVAASAVAGLRAEAAAEVDAAFARAAAAPFPSPSILPGMVWSEKKNAPRT